MKTSDTKVISKTINKIADVVCQTMGAKGRLAVINDEFSRPLLTDDGVTVAKQFMHLDDPFERMVALSVCEGASNTEKYAFDGTTLTILLTKELYNLGAGWMKTYGHDAQLAAKLVESNARVIRNLLKQQAFPLTPALAADLAVVTTKIPLVGDLVFKAYEKAGDAMNVLIEHERKSDSHEVETVHGMVLDSGYFSNEMQQLCNDESRTKTTFMNAQLVLLAEGILSQRDITEFFRSIPAEHVNDPYVFFVSRAFNPESLKMLLDQLVANKMKFQFVFINDANAEEIFLDIAAYTSGHAQSAASGTSSYRFSHTGFAEEITIEIDKTTIIVERGAEEPPVNERVEQRIAAYNKELEDNKYSISITRQDAITRRLANLKGSVVKIKLGCQTATEFLTLKLKLDDAIGAVRCAAKEGLLLGGGKALWNVYTQADAQQQEAWNRCGITALLQSPLRTIVGNSGVNLTRQQVDELNNNKNIVFNVMTGGLVDGVEAGLVDSFSSIDRALSNAVSIATSYLKAYILINTIA